ncbi:MAG TPA: PAS domain-containing protein [Anaeromyxobacter sp.]|nr:PAS domain-containing protein [Anaeromyxobacter sp.]
MARPPDALRFQRFVESSPMGMLFYRLEGGRLVLSGANPAANRILGVDLAPHLGKTLEEVFPALAATEIPARYRAAVETGEPFHSDLVEYRDERIAGAFEVDAFRTAPGELAVTFLEITARKRVEEALRRSEEKYRLVVENQEDLVVKLDRDLRFLFASESFCRLFGKAEGELVGTPFADLLPRDELPTLAAAFAEVARPPHVAKAEHRHRAATALGARVLAWTGRAILDEAGEVAAVVASGRDVTERRRMEDRLRQAEKLQGVGRLAGGVAHDFNNQLAAMLANADVLVEALAGAPELRAAAEQIRAAAQRSARLTRQLLAFARKGNAMTVPVDVHEAIADVITLLRRSIDKRIAISTDLRAVPSVVTGDPTQLHNALLNLALNARDAMPDGGTLRFATRSGDPPPERRAEAHAPLPPGPLVEITVADDGAGMDAETLAHVFEPFFTTKPAGEGVGLGLAAVYGTIESHGGAIAVASAPGRGTTFTIWLPPGAAEAGAEAAPPEPPHAPPARRARILVVDDERLVRETLARVLRREGHDVVLASGGVEGVTLYSGAPREIDVVILDMVMPDLGGPQVHAALCAINPAVRVVLSSGYSVEGAMTDVVAGGRAWVLQKPFALEDVRRVVGEALAAGAPPPG